MFTHGTMWDRAVRTCGGTISQFVVTGHESDGLVTVPMQYVNTIGTSHIVRTSCNLCSSNGGTLPSANSCRLTSYFAMAITLCTDYVHGDSQIASSCSDSVSQHRHLCSKLAAYFDILRSLQPSEAAYRDVLWYLRLEETCPDMVPGRIFDATLVTEKNLASQLCMSVTCKT